MEPFRETSPKLPRTRGAGLHKHAHTVVKKTPKNNKEEPTYLNVLADGEVEDLSVLRHPVELDLLGVEDELANDHGLVLRRVARRRQEFLPKKINKSTHTTKIRPNTHPPTHTHTHTRTHTHKQSATCGKHASADETHSRVHPDNRQRLT